MSPENQSNRTILGELPSKLDFETQVMSVGVEYLDGFQSIIELGEQALPELLLNMENPAWWRMQAIWTIADRIERPIYFPDEIKGNYASIRDQIIIWAVANGYTKEQP